MRSLDMYDEHVALDVCQESYFFLRLPEGVRPDLSLWLIFLYVNFFFFFRWWRRRQRQRGDSRNELVDFGGRVFYFWLVNIGTVAV